MEIREIKYDNWKIIYNKSLNYKMPELFFTDIYKEKNFLKILKNDNRSFVAIFIFEGKKLVLKIPKEKNRRKWIRFMTLFRKSEAVRNFYELKNILDSKLITAIPVAALEKRQYRMVVDSFVVYEYLDGEDITEKNYQDMIAKLKEIHKLGYVHGDSQIRNFLLCGSEIGIIDSRFSKKIFGKLSEAYEMWYLRKSGEKLVEYMKKESKKISFKFIEIIFFIVYGLKKAKKTLKRNLGKLRDKAK